MAKDNANQKKEKKHFFKDFKAELKKVIWPTPKQIVNSTIAVITIVLVTAVIVFVLDLAFEGLNKYGVNKLRDIIKNDETENVIEDNTIDAEDGIELDLENQVGIEEDNEGNTVDGESQE